MKTYCVTYWKGKLLYSTNLEAYSFSHAKQVGLSIGLDVHEVHELVESIVISNDN